MSGNSTEEDRGALEGGLGSMIKQTGEGFSLTGGSLVDGAVARGRRRAVGRRAAVVTGSVTALAVIALGGSYMTGGIAGGGASDASVGSSSARTGYTDEQMISTLKALMPKGDFSQESGRGTATTDSRHPLPPSASVVYDDGKGAAAVSLRLTLQDPYQDPDEAMACPDRNLVAFESCSSTALDDGSRLTLFKGWETRDHKEGARYWYANLLTPEGHLVSLSQWNAPAEKGAAVSRPAPPLSPDRMRALVRAEEWKKVLAAAPRPADQAASGQPSAPKGVSGEAILERLTGLLPKRLAVKTSGKQATEYAYIVVDDGRGRSFVQINVQTDMSDVAGDLVGPDTETLEDGTRVTTRRGSGDKGIDGVKMWTVDTIRPDGFRVVVSAMNAPDQTTGASRENPALTLAELRKIATSPVWLR
ncbi:hypothetical protein ACGFYA_04190 [Streptomyces sp. NPDC048305]|uniref:hypothetical protein n=1 Tax=Streptomyces sp. NPDC048305 TaxID=3365532 RepID=UPI0037152CA9